MQELLAQSNLVGFSLVRWKLYCAGGVCVWVQNTLCQIIRQRQCFFSITYHPNQQYMTMSTTSSTYTENKKSSHVRFAYLLFGHCMLYHLPFFVQVFAKIPIFYQQVTNQLLSVTFLEALKPIAAATSAGKNIGILWRTRQTLLWRTIERLKITKLEKWIIRILDYSTKSIECLWKLITFCLWLEIWMIVLWFYQFYNSFCSLECTQFNCNHTSSS